MTGFKKTYKLITHLILNIFQIADANIWIVGDRFEILMVATIIQTARRYYSIESLNFFCNFCLLICRANFTWI